MSVCIYIVGILAVALFIGFALPLDLPCNSPDTFPDEEHLTNCKKFSTLEIAMALDEIGEGI